MADPKTPLDLVDRWGGVSEAMRQLGGVEKRLECDFREEFRGKLDWQVVLESVGMPVRGAMISPAVACFLCDKAIVIVMPQKIIITATHEMAIHEFVGPLVNTLNSVGIDVEWASFMKKSTSSPWTTNDRTMAHEYAHLKSTFPCGNPFIFGQIDADHYFYFVADNICRSPVRPVESDVQINIILYNIADTRGARPTELFEPTSTCVYRCEGNEFQGASFRGQVYEHIRAGGSSSVSGGRIVSYETNCEIDDAARRRFTGLVESLEPERFTVLILLDPQSQTALLLEERGAAAATAPSSEGAAMMIDLGNFGDSYAMVNKTLNEFAAGYFVLKVSYSRVATGGGHG